MIGFIKGQIHSKHAGFIIVNSGGVGYKIFITPILYAQIKTSETCEFYIHTYVREDQITLYGFETLEELEFFELLNTVAGVGPKSALGIMSVTNLKMIKSAIVSEDPSLFTKVSGIGKKTAERVIVELKEKLKEQGSAYPTAREHSDALDALIALGYSQQQAREALKQVPESESNIQEKIKIALKHIR